MSARRAKKERTSSEETRPVDVDGELSAVDLPAARTAAPAEPDAACEPPEDAAGCRGARHVAPSVSAMIRRMSREGLVESDQRTGVILTREGRQSAESIVRRHRLAERMVVDLLGVDLAKAHEEAHRLEHAISPELEENIVAKLGIPRRARSGIPFRAAATSLPKTRYRSIRPHPARSWSSTGSRRTTSHCWRTSWRTASSPARRSRLKRRPPAAE